MIHASNEAVELNGEALLVLAEYMKVTRMLKDALRKNGIQEDYIGILFRAAWEDEERRER